MLLKRNHHFVIIIEALKIMDKNVMINRFQSFKR